MARPIKRLRGELDVVKDLRRRSRSTSIGMRDGPRAKIILLRLDGVGVEAVARRRRSRRQNHAARTRRVHSRRGLRIIELLNLSVQGPFQGKARPLDELMTSSQ